MMQTENKSARLKVYCDENAVSPRDWDNVGTMVCWHKRYTLGDKHDYKTPQEFLDSADAKSAFVRLPVYLYDHSVQKLSTKPFLGRAPHADWDSGQVGFIYASRERVLAVTDWALTEENKDAVREILEAETELYSSYLEGDCYAFSIEDLSGNILDNCGGFYGETMSDILNEMKQHAAPEHRSLFDKIQSYTTLYASMT